jgi:hypothetical protein
MGRVSFPNSMGAAREEGEAENTGMFAEVQDITGF